MALKTLIVDDEPIARQVLRDYKATDGLFPTQHIPRLREAAIKKYADRIELEVANQ